MELPRTVSELVLHNATLGQMANMDCHQIPHEAFARGINVQTRQGHVQTRPGMPTRILTNVDSGHDALTEFARGKFQGCSIYQSETTLWLIAAVSGRLYRIDLLGWTIECLSRRQDATGKEYALNEYVDRCYMVQAERYFIVQDGINTAIIFDGDTVFRAHPTGTNEGADFITVPTGTLMAFGHGRLFIKIDKSSFLAGDIWKADAPEECLQFTETDYLAQGGALGFPANLGTIQGMKFIQNVSSGDGMGELTVFGEYGAAGYQVQLPRASWQTTDICKVLTTEHGCLAAQGIVGVNQDLCYQAGDGIRSLKLNMTEAGSMWYGMLGTRVLSAEVQNFTALETPWLVPFISGCQWDNRLFMASGGMLLQAEDLAGNKTNDYGFTGLLSLDFMNVSHLDQKLKPTWDGMWMRYPVLQIVSANFQGNRCFIIAKTPDYKNVLLEIDKGSIADGDTPIYCQVATRGVTFSNSQMSVEDALKQVKLVEGWIEDIFGDLTVAVFFKTDDYPVWLPMSQRYFCVPNGGPDYPSAPWMPQARVRTSFEEPPTYNHPSTGRLLNLGYIVQLLITWSGHAILEKFRLKGILSPEVPEDIKIENCNAVTSMVPQISDSGSAFSDPATLQKLADLMNNILQPPYEYPSQLQFTPAATAIADGQLVTTPSNAPSAYKGPKAPDPAAKQYWRWKASCLLTNGVWVQVAGTAATQSSTVDEVWGGYSYPENDSCRYTLYGPKHYDNKRNTHPFDGNLSDLPDKTDFDDKKFTASRSDQGTWNDFHFERSGFNAYGTTAKTFMVEADDGDTVNYTLQVTTNGSQGEGDAWTLQIYVDGSLFAESTTSQDSLLTTVDLACRRHVVELRCFSTGTAVQGQWTWTANWVCGDCSEGVYADKAYLWETSPVWINSDGFVPVPEGETADLADMTHHVVTRYWPVTSNPGSGPATPTDQPDFAPTDHPCKVKYLLTAKLRYGSALGPDRTCDEAVSDALSNEHHDGENSAIEFGDDESAPVKTNPAVLAALCAANQLGDDGSSCQELLDMNGVSDGWIARVLDQSTIIVDQGICP